MIDTIFALSSGGPPAAIGVIRISGPAAAAVVKTLAGRLPEPRRASLAKLRDRDGAVLDNVMALWLPGPNTATGEDLAELHCHGGRAVIAAVEMALSGHPGVRRAEPGEFTRRAFANGIIDLAEAEGLADLLAAETESQRRSAMALAGGAFSSIVDRWREDLLSASAALEAILDFADEDGVDTLPVAFAGDVAALANQIAAHLAAPRAEHLRDGFRVVIAGPPNSGKSTLFNALVEDQAAIATPVPGTTRDLLQRPVAILGVPFVIVDTAGLRESTHDPIEHIGIERAVGAIADADLVLWLGPECQGPPGSWDVAAQADIAERIRKQNPRHLLSAVTGKGMGELRRDLVRSASAIIPGAGQVALNRRQRSHLERSEQCLRAAASGTDMLIVAEELRQARVAFDGLLGNTATEDVLDSLFGRFCIGK